MFSLLVLEALEAAITEIEDAVGLSLVPEKSFVSLYGRNKALLARVPNSTDPLGDIDRVRSFWFQTARNLSNEAWD